MVSFSQHPTDPNTILGGAQDIGSPATSSSQSNTGWANVNSGDGGYNQINPDNPTDWFTANTGVSIQRCAFGVDYRPQDFSSGLVVSDPTLGGDSGGLFTPFILDPQNSGELLVGTCRVWRGATDGSGFVALTDNFETGAGKLQRRRGQPGAVAGRRRPRPTAGFSNVMYAGNRWPGPAAFPPEDISGWPRTSAAEPEPGWIAREDQTVGISNLRNALDPSDATGKTAYMTIMGFHVSHVWKTTDAGASWTTSPPACRTRPPMPYWWMRAAGTVYVATDVGVFASGTASPAGQKLDPNRAAQRRGLPNVAVTALRMFDFGGTKKLRASTYGRGIWEFTLAEGPNSIYLAGKCLTAFVGAERRFQRIFAGQNGFSSPVNLTCTPRATAARRRHARSRRPHQHRRVPAHASR